MSFANFGHLLRLQLLKSSSIVLHVIQQLLGWRIQINLGDICHSVLRQADLGADFDTIDHAHGATVIFKLFISLSNHDHLLPPNNVSVIILVHSLLNGFNHLSLNNFILHLLLILDSLSVHLVIFYELLIHSSCVNLFLFLLHILLLFL